MRRASGDLAAVGVLLVAVGAVAQLSTNLSGPDPAWLLLPAVAAAMVVVRTARRVPGDARWWILVGVLALLVATAAWPLLSRRQSDESWVRSQEEGARRRLTTAVDLAHIEQEALVDFVAIATRSVRRDSLEARDPFVVCRGWIETWRRLVPGDAARHMAVSLWRGDQRLAWDGPVIPSEVAPQPGTTRLMRNDRRWVTQTAALASGDGSVVVECQLWLADIEAANTGGQQRTIGVRRAVVRDARAVGERRWGDAQRGLRLAEDIVLGPSDSHGVQPRLRLTIHVPSRGLLDDRQHASVLLAVLVLAGVALLLWAAAGIPAWFWPVAWAVRWWWASVDVVRWLAGTLSTRSLPAHPGDLASLTDPAYFATTLAGGWFASSVDALLTALLIAGTAAWVWRRWPPSTSRATGSSGTRRWRMLILVPVVGGLAWGLRFLWSDLTANANARLIGLQVPLDAWTFWALHAVILMISLSAGSLFVLLAFRLRGSVPRTVAGSARAYWLAGGLLAVVLINYFVLSGTYDRAEREWLERKAEQIVMPQDEWIGFLVEDVLGDMVGHDAAGDDPAEVAAGRGVLRRDQPAYRLWRRSAVRDLGLPGLVEMLDANGNTESLYATGFLRDFGYEVVSRSDWWSLSDADGQGPGRDGVLLQDEVHRYPTGQERILRGEIARADGRGWLRLELPVQSLRISTLMRRLAGAQDTRTGGGYRPRLEVDRPLLILRGDAQRWLDTGFAEMPGAAVEPTLAALRRGQTEWVDVSLEDHRWLCRWAALPPESASTPGEGFVLGLQRRGIVDVLLDVGRLLLLDVLLLLGWFGARALLARRWRWVPGFQGRFLLGYLGIGLVLLLVAGSLADRQTFRRIDQEARAQTRDGLVTALGQLRGLLAEQARALAGSDYIADLLAGRLGGDRRLGPFAVRQGIVFGPDGELLLDETLSNLDADAAARLLDAARNSSLVVMQQPDGLYLGVGIPIDLGDLADGTRTGGTFFYRQLVDDQLLPGLAEVVGGEVTLRVDGEVIVASHPGRVLAGESPLLADPWHMRWFAQHPDQPRLQTNETGLAFSGGIGIPALATVGGDLVERALPAILSVEFPGRQRDFTDQRRRMVLFLAGLITVLLLTAFGLAMMLSWSIFEPLRVLLGATRRLAAGDYSAPLPPGRGDEVGRLASGFRTMRDELQHAREELEAREKFLSGVLERVPVGVLVWDDTGRVASSNPAAHEILSRFYPDVAAATAKGAATWSSLLRRDLGASLGDGSGELSSDDGRRTLRVGQAPLELGGQAPHRLVVCEDLTEFLATKKMALNAELARQVAHEIKNPLTPIQLSAQLIEQASRDHHPHLDTIIQDAVRRIVEQVSLLRQIAGEFSLLGRPGELECKPLDLAALVNDVIGGYRTEVPGHGPAVDVEVHELPAVLADRESLVKVLGNLMQNSLDACGDPDALVLAVRWRVEPQTVALVWSDNGPGIAPDVAGRLFDPYFSTKSKGTGLGLAICRNLLDKMGGTIALTNARGGGGAMATVTLPRADAVAAAGDSNDG